MTNCGVWATTTKDDQITYEYHNGKLVKVIDRYGNTIKYHYEDGKNSIGRILTINYEGDKVKSIQDSTGRIVTYTYNNSGMLETVKDLNGNIPC